MCRGSHNRKYINHITSGRDKNSSPVKRIEKAQIVRIVRIEPFGENMLKDHYQTVCKQVKEKRCFHSHILSFTDSGKTVMAGIMIHEPLTRGIFIS